MTAVKITQFPVGTPQDGDRLYGFTRLTNPLATFGHNIVKRDATGKPTAGYDASFGTVLLGFKVAAGDTAKIATLWKSTFALYFSSKLLAFEGSTQIG